MCGVCVGCVHGMVYCVFMFVGCVSNAYVSGEAEKVRCACICVCMCVGCMFMWFNVVCVGSMCMMCVGCVGRVWCVGVWTVCACVCESTCRSPVLLG